MERLIVLDTETTGIEIRDKHRIIEIGCCEILDREITNSEFHEYIQPDRAVGESVKIHGITDKFLVGKVKFEEIADEFLEYIEGSTLVIHNAPFDLGFLNHELKIAGIDKTIENMCNIIDSLALSKQQRPRGMHGLDALCRRFEVDASSRVKHGALLDAQILAQVYLAMTGGQSSLFTEDTTDQKKQSNNSRIIKFDAKNGKIKLTKANDDEIIEHQNYFS